MFQLVHDYSFTPPYIFPKGRSGHTMLTVEMDIAGNPDHIVDVVEKIDPAVDHLYLKRDDTLDGLVIVTHPMTAAWAATYPFGNLIKELRRNGCEHAYALRVFNARTGNQFTFNTELVSWKFINALAWAALDE